MARITFVYPDFESLGVAYLMAVCADAGHEVAFVYYEAEDPYLGKGGRALDYDGIALRIIETRPDIAAFSAVTDNFRFQLKTAEALKKQQPEIMTIFGGIHPTAVPEKTLGNGAIDVVAVGEAEESLVAFLDAAGQNAGFRMPEKPVSGMIFRKNGHTVGEAREGDLADLNSLPFPHKKAFLSVLKDAAHEYRIMSSRGCPYRCSYCFNSSLNRTGGETIRRRSVENVIAEIKQAQHEFGIKRILFVDDSFTTGKSWIREFCGRYRTEIALPFACIANPNYIDEEIAHTLADAGCVNVQLGIQSISETLCAEILQRKSSNTHIARAIETLKKYKIMVQVDHMLGIPGDTIDAQEASIRFYNIHRPNLISIFWLTYYPGTAIIDTALKTGEITPADVEKIEQGIRLTTESYLTGGSMKDPAPFYAVVFLLNWLPLIPKWTVSLLLKSRMYRLFKIKHYMLSTALPRVIQSIFNKRDFRGRSHLVRFIGKTLGMK